MKFNEFLLNNKNKNIDIYFDMDGVFAEYDVGNFDYSNIRPIKSIINLMEKLLMEGINVKVLSICKNNKIVKEKYDWINKYASFLKKDNINFISKEDNPGFESSELKSKFLRERVNKNYINVLVDDDILIIKKVIKENKDVKVFHISSIIE